MSGPQPVSATPNQSPGATPFGMVVGAVTLMLCGGALFLFGRWLLEAHGPALDWGANPTPAISLGVLPAILAMHGCRTARWAEVSMAFLAASVVATALMANIVAAAVLLWAIDPAVARGGDGFFAASIAGVLLSLPVAFGASALLQRWQAAGLPWREWFRSEHFRRTTMLGILLGFAGFFLCVVAGALLESWLGDVYPGAGGFYSAAAAPAAILVMMTLLLTGPSDMGTVLRSLLAAAVVFETAFAAKITMAVVAITLGSDSLLLLMADMPPAIAVFIGAMLLVACKPGGRGDAPTDAAQKEAG